MDAILCRLRRHLAFDAPTIGGSAAGCSQCPLRGGATVITTAPPPTCDCDHQSQDCLRDSCLVAVRTIFMCLYYAIWSIGARWRWRHDKLLVVGVVFACVQTRHLAAGYASEFDKTEQFLDKINLEKSIAAVFNKVAYGSTTKRSIPDTAYPVTTLATPLLTTYRYSDGNDQWLRVDVKDSDGRRGSVDFEPDLEGESRRDLEGGAYGMDLEKDHALPTSAPAADILKNNNNKNYNNPNRYNNDRLRPDYATSNSEQVTENIYKTTTSYNALRNVRPTKSVYSKDPPNYVPPSRSFFTPPLPPEYQNPFADKPTLRGTNSDGFVNRRPLPPPSLMPNKDRIPFRPPDLQKVNSEKPVEGRQAPPQQTPPMPVAPPDKQEKKKSLNTPSQNHRLGDAYGNTRNVNDSNFEYDKSYGVPAITRILSGSNGRHDDIPDILLRTVTATPKVPAKPARAPSAEPSLKLHPEKPILSVAVVTDKTERPAESVTKQQVIVEPEPPRPAPPIQTVVVTTQIADMVNLPNVREKDGNVTKASSDEIWLICWKVHVYLVVFGYIVLAFFSIFKLIRYENDPHMFSKSYFLTIHLMLTVICVLRIFYLTYDPYNVAKSFNVFLYDFLHSFPLSLLATTFAVLILFLLKRTLTHLEVKTRPVFLVVFALLHILLCFCLSIFETFGYLEKANLTICKPVFVLLAWALGFSYLYLYKIIKNVLAKKSQNLSEMCTQNISYASHITIAVALLFILLGFVQLYALFFIKVDRFNSEIKHHWILWSFELSVRFIEISIITLLAIVVSLKMSQREKQTAGGFPLFPCTTSDSSTDNIYPNNCNTNPNALNYSRQEMIMDNLPTEPERPNLLKNAFQNDSFDKKSTLERYQSDNSTPTPSQFDRFERPKWGSDRFDSASLTFTQSRAAAGGGGSARKTYDAAKYYTKPKYDEEPYHTDRNIYSEPIDNNQYERTRHEFERSDFDRRSRNSSNTSGRRSRKNHPRPHLGVQTLPNHDRSHAQPDSMLVDEQGFVRFRHMDEMAAAASAAAAAVKKSKKPELNHYSDA